jgi:hypothetical protein
MKKITKKDSTNTSVFISMCDPKVFVAFFLVGVVIKAKFFRQILQSQVEVNNLLQFRIVRSDVNSSSKPPKISSFKIAEFYSIGL